MHEFNERNNENDVVTTLDSFIGQQSLIDTLKVCIAAAKLRNESLGHILLTGPSGSGKSTLAEAIAAELNTNIKVISFNVIKRESDLVAILTSIGEGEVLFAENFGSIRNDCVEILYTALDSFCMDLVIGKGPTARSVRLDLPAFTFIATMDEPCRLPAKLVDCFLVNWKMESYTVAESVVLAMRCADQMSVKITDEAAEYLAAYSKGSYRKLKSVLKRARDFATIRGNGIIDMTIAQNTIALLTID